MASAGVGGRAASSLGRRPGRACVDWTSFSADAAITSDVLSRVDQVEQRLVALVGVLLGEGHQHPGVAQLGRGEAAGEGPLLDGRGRSPGVTPERSRAREVVGVEQDRLDVVVAGERLAAVHLPVLVAEADQRLRELLPQIAGLVAGQRAGRAAHILRARAP
ncbi:hypothetical protein [Nannocystis sp. SCPEA4]|uniref:hypothetical protein n=1 Tax=Nannocystis sp. SCPEA4 TaxID=2996787 RepID=UPI0022710EF0|nr:hypothetical protein [Nannocystis sp. SCPEA4]MCY1055472.1 hypothetical protein [Nannocystis sp. SCPEA4]